MNPDSWIVKTISSGLYTLGWLVCVLSGSVHWTVLPLVFTAVVTLGLLSFLFYQDRPLGLGTALLISYGAVLGLGMEALFLRQGWVHYATENSLSASIPPGWLWCLYFLFLPTLKLALDPLRHSYYLAALFGAVGAPFSYVAGASLGAVRLSSSYSLVSIALCWAVYMVIVVLIDRRIKKRLLFLGNAKE